MQVDLSVILSVFSLLVSLLTVFYLYGHKIGTIENKMSELKDAINRINAQFSPSWHEDYGRIKGQVELLIKSKYEDIVAKVISQLHSILEEILMIVLEPLNIKPVQIEIHVEKEMEKILQGGTSNIAKAETISEIATPSRLYVFLKAKIKEEHEVSSVTSFDVNEEGLVVPKFSEILEITDMNGKAIPLIETQREARIFRTALAKEIRGYIDTVMPVLASVISYLILQEKSKRKTKQRLGNNGDLSPLKRTAEKQGSGQVSDNSGSAPTHEHGHAC